MSNNQNPFNEMMKMFEKNPMMEMFKNFDMNSVQNNKMMNVNELMEMQKNNAEKLVSMCQSGAADCQAIMKKYAQMLQNGSNQLMQVQKDLANSVTNPEKNVEKMVEKISDSQSQHCKKLLESGVNDTSEIMEMLQKSNMDMYKNMCDQMLKSIDELSKKGASTAKKATKAA